jgi:hypothetical protein
MSEGGGPTYNAGPQISGYNQRQQGAINPVTGEPYDTPSYPQSTPSYPAQNSTYSPQPQEDYSPFAAPPPGQASTPRGGQASAPRGGGGGGAEVTADDILSNLEGAEEAVYGNAFLTMAGGQPVGLDNAAMRDFICTNSSIGMDDIDLELLKVASPDEGLTRDGFIMLLREFAVSDGDSISQFMGLSSDGESLASEECRTGLLMFAQEKLNARNFSDERWERIFNTVMWDAGVSLSMEQWLGYTKTTGRIVRLFTYARV